MIVTKRGSRTLLFRRSISHPAAELPDGFLA